MAARWLIVLARRPRRARPGQRGQFWTINQAERPVMADVLSLVKPDYRFGHRIVESPTVPIEGRAAISEPCGVADRGVLGG